MGEYTNMTFKRFSQLWDTLITNKPRPNNVVLTPETKMSEKTKEFLIKLADKTIEKDWLNESK